MKKMTFLVACKDYFGYKDGQTLTQFRDEINKLTPKDREDLTKMFLSVGYEIIPV